MVAMKFSSLHQIIDSEQSSREARKNCNEMNGVALGIVYCESKLNVALSKPSVIHALNYNE